MVCIVAVDNRKRVYCVRQWRPARNDYVWELPAGGVESQQPSDEIILQNANRELQEEIGFKSNRMEILSVFSPAVHIQSHYYIVLATELEKSSLPKDIGEELEIVALPIDEAFDLLINQQLPSSLTLVGMLMAKERF